MSRKVNRVEQRREEFSFVGTARKLETTELNDLRRTQHIFDQYRGEKMIIRGTKELWLEGGVVTIVRPYHTRLKVKMPRIGIGLVPASCLIPMQVQAPARRTRRRITA